MLVADVGGEEFPKATLGALAGRSDERGVRSTMTGTKVVHGAA